MERTSANTAIDSMIIGKESRYWKHIYVKDDAVPRCDIDNKIIYSPKFGPLVNEKDDVLVRGKNIHEAAHARLTPVSPESGWTDLKRNVVNALEDLRIERAVSELNPTVQKDLFEFEKRMNEECCKRFSDEEHLKNIKPINEALAAMMFRSQGFPVDWKMSEKGQKYFDAAKDVFEEYKNLPNQDKPEGFYEVIKLADRVIEALKEANQSKKPDDKEENEENKDKKESEENKDKKENEDSGQDSNGEGGSNNKDEKEKDKNKDKNQSGGNSGEEEDGENSEGNEESNDGENSDGDDSENQDGSNEESSNSHKHHEGEYKPTDKEGKPCEYEHSEEKSDKELEEELNSDVDAKDAKEEILNDKMKEVFKKSLEESGGFTSYRELDRFVEVKDNIENYENSRNAISVQIGRLSNYTEEALKYLSRCQKMSNLERGKIDKKKLSSLSKSLTKKVFYKTRDGIDLDCAVTILVDESGSIGAMKYGLRTLAIAFSEVFQKLNINFEVLGYTTFGFNPSKPGEGFDRTVPIKMKVYKAFKENYNIAKYRLGNIESECHNADGESLLYAYNRLQKEHTRRKIVFVLSDGEPCCGEHDYKIGTHLKKVVKDIRNNGDEVYAFGIGTKSPKEFYGENFFVYLEGINELGPVFFNRFKEVIAKTK